MTASGGNQVATGMTYEAVGDSLEQALARIHEKIPPRTGSDFAISRLVDWGAQFGGFALSLTFWVRVEVDEFSPFKT
jgi:hypothetical protein